MSHIHSLPPLTIHHILYFRKTTVLGPFCHAIIHPIHRVKSQPSAIVIQGRMIVRTHHQLVLPGHKLIRLVIQVIQGTLPVQIKFQHRNLLVVSQHDIIHRECRVRSQVMQVHLVVHGIEHIRELGMKGKTRRFVKIRGVQILVFRLLDKTVSRHIDPVNATFPGVIFENRINEATGITGTLHIHQFHSRLETEQTIFRVRQRGQCLHNICIIPTTSLS